jgi:hypothetical protein
MRITAMAIRMLLALIIFLVTLGSSLEGDDSTTGREAVRRGTNPVWVDRSSHEVKIPSQQLQRSDVSDRHDSIRSNAGRSIWDRWFGSSWQSGNSNGAVTDFLTWVFNAWRILVFLMLAVLIGLGLFVLLRMKVFQNMFQPRKRGALEEDVEQQRSRISDLPFDIEQPVLGLRAQAEKFRAEGDYSKALIYLFSYLLVELDQAHCIRLERGKTNGQYLRELRSWPDLNGSMQPIVQLFEFVYFGRNPLDRNSLDAVWSRLSGLDRAIAEARSSKVHEEPGALLPMLSRSGA